jgi:hypothetical protein
VRSTHESGGGGCAGSSPGTGVFDRWDQAEGVTALRVEILGQ